MGPTLDLQSGLVPKCRVCLFVCFYFWLPFIEGKFSLMFQGKSFDMRVCYRNCKARCPSHLASCFWQRSTADVSLLLHGHLQFYILYAMLFPWFGTVRTHDLPTSREPREVEISYALSLSISEVCKGQGCSQSKGRKKTYNGQGFQTLSKSNSHVAVHEKSKIIWSRSTS